MPVQYVLRKVGVDARITILWAYKRRQWWLDGLHMLGDFPSTYIPRTRTIVLWPYPNRNPNGIHKRQRQFPLRRSEISITSNIGIS